MSETESTAAADGAGPAATASAGGADLARELELARERALRAQAELDNYRKRMQRELEEERKFAQLPLIRDLLPVIDNVERAIEAAEKGGDVSGLLAGFRMVSQQLEETLGRHQCRRIPALNEPFDPNLHQAIAQQPSAEHPPHTVAAVAQAGYRLHDRVVRPAQVMVTVAPAR